MPYRDGPHHESETFMSFKLLDLLKPNEHREDYYIRKQNTENILFGTEEKVFFVGENLVNFWTNDKIVKYFTELGFNKNNYPFAHSEENIYFMLLRKYIPFEEYKNSTQKDECEYLYKKDDELKDEIFTSENGCIIEHGNDFI